MTLELIDSNVSSHFIIGWVLCASFAVYFSFPFIWIKYFGSETDTYLKAGEYGESEMKVSWSLWKEPLNSITSLAYSLFGFAILSIGIQDLSGSGLPANTTSQTPGFSILYGISCIYLGVASFLFHASHSEMWRKADAGACRAQLPLDGFSLINNLFCDQE